MKSSQQLKQEMISDENTSSLSNSTNEDKTVALKEIYKIIYPRKIGEGRGETRGVLVRTNTLVEEERRMAQDQEQNILAQIVMHKDV